MGKIVATFDRNTLLIIGICWSVTLALIILSLVTIRTSITAKKEAEQALIAEPVLPQVRHGGIGGKELQVMIERLQHRYPEVSVTWTNNTLTIASPNGGMYHQWLMAIGQVDTIYPQFHWAIKGICVGKGCGSQNLMSIDLVGERLSFEMPQTNEKK